MSQFFLGQIMMTGFGYAQKNFAQCNGYLMAIQQNTALFTLLGAYYGGDGIRTFALPDLRGQTPVGAGNSFDSSWQPPPYGQGQPGGTEAVILTIAALPPHNHGAAATKRAGSSGAPVQGGLLAKGGNGVDFYADPAAPIVDLAPGTIGNAGNSLAHSNLQPSATINFNIALNGIYPSRS